jgi:hypothetical protein
MKESRKIEAVVKVIALTSTEQYLLKLGISPMPRVLMDTGVRRVSRRKLVK